MTTLITGAGLVGTSYAQYAVRRGEKVVFVDPIPRQDFIRAKLGNADFVQINEAAGAVTQADGGLGLVAQPAGADFRHRETRG